MLTLLSLLQARRDWPGSLLAGRLAVSERTVRRDVDRLRELGYRIHAVKGPDGGYRLEAGSELPPLLFDDDQVLALTIALQTAAVGGGVLEEAALRALTTVRQVMPSRLRHRMDSVELTASPLRRPVPVDPETLVRLGESIRANEVVRFDYGSTEDAAPPRRAEPLHLATRSGRWYLIAWDLDRDRWATFRVDRIALRSHAGGRFTPRALPGGDPAAFLSARFKGSEDADTWPCWGEAVLAAPAHRVAPFIDDGTVEPVDPAHCRVRLGSWSWIALAAALGRFDAEVSAVSPPELAQAFAALAQRFSTAAGSSHQ